MTLQSISVGIDSSKAAQSALAWATGLADTVDASLRVMHAWQSPSVCIYPAAPTAQEAERHARNVVQTALAGTDSARQIEPLLLRGAAGPALVQGARDSDVLVVGREDEDLVAYKPQFGELIGGSAARYCARHGRVAVAAINPGASWVDAPHVVVGIDGSPASLEALRWATDYLPTDATIHAVRAVGLEDAQRNAPLDYELLDPLLAEHRHELEQLVAANVGAGFAEAGRVAQAHVVLGYAQDGLLDPGFRYDMIVVGEHGNAAEDGAPLGSVSDHTLRNSVVPIVIVHATESDAER